MIISENRKLPLTIFQDIMKKTDIILNEDALRREDYYSKRSGKVVEQDVFQAVCAASNDTEFEGTIRLVSGVSFPDIVANKYYGVEVKSTEKDHWTSIGSSILESTRILDVERIYLTFGKLGKPVKFLSRPYEECLYGIAVTHYPRYKIDMRLKKGETIFDKMGISYDELRRLDNPVTPVSKYYKEKLKPGESLWWVADDVDATAPATVRLWTALSHEQKEKLTVQGYALFPEILSAGNNKKYNRYALWLATRKAVVNTNIRDSFSAGGKVNLSSTGGILIKMPAVFGQIKKYHELIQKIIDDADEQILLEYWNVDEIYDNRIRQWCHLVANAADSSVGYSTAWDVLSCIFLFINEDHTKVEGSACDNKRISKVAEENSYYNVASIITCSHCGKKYKQIKICQTEGLRFEKDDECPYCHGLNGESREWQFKNSIISEI